MDTLQNWLAHLIERFASDEPELEEMVLQVCVLSNAPRWACLAPRSCEVTSN
jgi:hypothetical protein